MLRFKNIKLTLIASLAVMAACSESVLYPSSDRDPRQRPPFATPVPAKDAPNGAKSSPSTPMELSLDAEDQGSGAEPLEVIFGADAIAQFNRDNGAFDVAAGGQPKLNMSLSLSFVSARDEIFETMAAGSLKLELWNRAKDKVLLSREFKSLGNITLTGKGDTDHMLGLIEANETQITIEGTRSASVTNEAEALVTPWTGTLRVTNERGVSSRLGTFKGPTN